MAEGAADARPGAAAAAVLALCRAVTDTFRLDWRTGHRAIGAEHAAVARLRPQRHAASGALVENTAGVGGHGFGFGRATVRAGENGFENHRRAPQQRYSIR